MQLRGIATKCFEDSHALLEINFKHRDFTSFLAEALLTVCRECTLLDTSKMYWLSQLVSHLGPAHNGFDLCDRTDKMFPDDSDGRTLAHIAGLVEVFEVGSELRE